ncbi:MerR family transcriptional regulator [Compostimonas suwonensis]|uniref:DNA-binding transcriptional MerR regulator n=1 Tax=Compostimonas suwonensis TaxID=1048394 RepID=A0A2M9BBG1_9MICO|nr:MerR family transcriptional regulator [Compostimonas suwonensis]PJJ55285.1 DNA-binding transcriptional MerR regulator [Compostimonas suwonensis]
MGWSTREIAHLAGTTLRTVRHYHEIGILDEPERMPNGYKAYRTEHLVRLLQIRRLTRLGFSLATIASMEDEPEQLEETLLAIDAELAATIDQLTEARREIAQLRRRPAPTDLPFDISTAATEARLSPTDRSLFAVISHVVGGDSSQYLQALLQDYEPDDATGEFDVLPPDADEETRERLAQRIAPQMRALVEKHPDSPEIPRASSRQAAGTTLINAMLDLYNPAQLDVLVRIWRAAGLI